MGQGARGAQVEYGTDGSDGTQGAQGAQGLNGGGGNFSALSGATTDKSNVSGGSTTWDGTAKTYTVSGGSILAGQPVCLSITNTSITVKACDENTTSADIVGIATADTNSGSTVPILTSG